MGLQSIDKDIDVEVRDALLDAINEAELSRLRQVLKEGIHEHNAVFEWLKSKLLAEDHSEHEDGNEADNRKDGAVNPKNTMEVTEVLQKSPHKPKRLYPRCAVCEKCKQEFDVTQNKSPHCVFHTGLSPSLHLLPLSCQLSNLLSLANWRAL